MNFDPARLGDPVAAKAAWSPIAPWRANFRTHELVRAGDTLALFRASDAARLFSGGFAAAGIFIMLLGLFPELSNVPDPRPALHYSFFGFLFFGAGAFLYAMPFAPIVFDKALGTMCKGHPRLWSDKRADLASIHALQLLAREGLSNETHRPRLVRDYELNIVLDDGERVHVIVTTQWMHAIDEARILAKFLDKPLWNAAETAD